MLAMFQDTSVKVREAISWVMFMISQHHAEVIVGTKELTAQIVGALIHSLQDKPKVSVYLC